MAKERKIIRTLRQAGFTVLTRKQWGSKHRALYQLRRVTRRFVGPADHFVAHITVTNDTGDLIGDFKADCRTVERIGKERFGTGASYNWLVDQNDGTIALAMPHDAAGAHTLNDKGVAGFPENMNYWSHAIAWVGVPGDTPTGRAHAAYAAIIAAEKKHGAAKRTARIYPHFKFAWKDCPMPVLADQLDDIMRSSRTILRTTDTAAENRAQERAEAKAARKAARRRERRQERREAARQRLQEAARGEDANRIEQARALARIASNRAENPSRVQRIREWLRTGPKR